MAWKARATVLYLRFLPVSLGAFPVGTSLVSNPCSILLTTPGNSWIMIRKDFVNTLKILTATNDGRSRLRVNKYTTLTVKMPTELRVGSYCFRKIVIPYALAIALFREEDTGRFQFQEYEVVWHTATCLYVHIFLSDKLVKYASLINSVLLGLYVCERGFIIKAGS